MKLFLTENKILSGFCIFYNYQYLQSGGADGELTASLRYLNQRYAMPTDEIKGLLTDIGTEELAHLEIVSAIVYQLTRNMKPEDLQKYGFDQYFVDHTAGIYPANSSGIPFTAAYFQSKGDAFADLTEDMAAEQKARATYDNILRLIDNPDVIDPIRYLRQREIVHFQRFGEAMRMVQDRLDARNFYACNPSFDHKCGASCPDRCSHK